jgi:AAA15 family ATPase/GTPase
MLIRFEMENYRSFYDKVCYVSESRNKASNSELHYLNTFDNDRTKENYVKSSLLIGKNAGGKSNFVYGFKDFILMMINSFRRTEQIKQVQPFRLIPNNEKPTSFLCEFLEQDNWYRYQFMVRQNKVVSEKLETKVSSWTTIFERQSPEFESIQFPNKYKSQFAKLIEHTKENVLFLSVLFQFNVDFVVDIIEYFATNYTVVTPNSIYRNHGVTDTADIIRDEKHILRDRVLDFIKQSDFGISDIHAKVETIEKNEVFEKIRAFIQENDLGPIDTPEEFVSLYFEHGVFDSLSDCKGSYAFDSDFISDGTNRMVSLAGAIFYTLHIGGVLVIDEIEHKLHHLLVKRIVDMFNSIDINDKNAQLIFTSHDLLLLEEDIRRDQIWIVDKDECNKSRMYNLLDIPGVTKRTNILKQYLLGIYRGLPELEI